MSLTDLSALQLAEQLRTRQVSAREAVEAYLARISALDAQLGAFLTVTPEAARAQADALDRRRAQGEELPATTGLPVATKDNLSTREVRTTCGSKLLEHYVPPYDATAVARQHAAGLISLGKLNMDEFAMGSSTENSAFQKTRNPWDLARVPGGSSGGSAAAVAARLAPWATGSDTGGSIRQPAGFCGIVGMKPTYGRISRYGLVAFASSLDQIGPMTRDVRDNALLLSVLAGHDPLDSTSLSAAVPDYLAELNGKVQGLRVGVIRELKGQGVAADVRAAVEQAVKRLEGLGAVVEEVSLPLSAHGIAAYYLVATAEASSNLARYDGIKYTTRAEAADLLTTYLQTRAEGFGEEVKRRIMLGTYALSSGYYDAYYKKAQQVRTLLRQEYARAFERFDVLVGPTTPTTAYGLGEKTDDPLAMYLGDIATVPANLAGVPALSMPCGFDGQGLPIGLQLQGSPLSEALLYRVACALEAELALSLTPPVARRA